MTSDTFQRTAIDSTILGEAADWLVRFQSGGITSEDRQIFERWCNQSPAHAAAWQRAEAVLGVFGQVPTNIGRGTIQRLGKPGRRQALYTLGLLFVAAPAAWLAWSNVPWVIWDADVHTATGEQKALDLADGTRLVLNTASAVNIAFTVNERRLRLEVGEILITTGRDPSPTSRPFIVQTLQGTVRALGTRFAVRRFEESTHVAVFDGAVEIRPFNTSRFIIVSAGEQVTFQSAEIQSTEPVDDSAALWKDGMLVARDMRLAELIAELARYRSGILRCHSDVANVRVSGAFSLKDTDASLQLLQKTLPLRIHSLTRYWVSIEPA